MPLNSLSFPSQVDSMSYLITPLLLESGMLSEASRQYRHMFLFHTGARRDTAEMITKCFKFGNYTKALELSNFSEKCKKLDAQFSQFLQFYIRGHLILFEFTLFT